MALRHHMSLGRLGRFGVEWGVVMVWKHWGKVPSKPWQCLTGWVQAARSNIGWSSVKSLRVKSSRHHGEVSSSLRIPAAHISNNAEIFVVETVWQNRDQITDVYHSYCCRICKTATEKHQSQFLSHSHTRQVQPCLWLYEQKSNGTQIDFLLLFNQSYFITCNMHKKHSYYMNGWLNGWLWKSPSAGQIIKSRGVK